MHILRLIHECIYQASTPHHISTHTISHEHARADALSNFRYLLVHMFNSHIIPFPLNSHSQLQS